MKSIKQTVIESDVEEKGKSKETESAASVGRNETNLAVCTIVVNREGEVNFCDVPFSDNLQQFNADYLRLTKQVAESCQNHDLTDSMVIGTSALAGYER